MGSQDIEPARAGATLLAESATHITRNRIVLSPVDPFHDVYLRCGSMNNTLEKSTIKDQYDKDDDPLCSS